MSNDQHTGMTRTSIQRDHALICPASHVPVRFPEWPGCEAVVLISPEMGAKFTQMLVNLDAGATMAPLTAGEEWFVLVLEGRVTLSGHLEGVLDADGFASLAAATDWQIEASTGGRLLVFSKPYIATTDALVPASFVSRLEDVPADPFLGDPGALLQVLLPDTSGYDWGINLFEFVPGGTLPQVESHFMEHGLYLLAGQGVYRLGEHWYPVAAGDTIWMGPYVPQWFAATGKHNARYIYYKEMNRPPGAVPG
ncbi:MAG: (S)-ureidoglycine aminohydrolase [Pseudomonadota bacterium]